MSDRSAKLLLRYAEAIEQSMKTAPHLKMAGVRSVPADVGLVSETLDWARGYRQHVKTIMRKRSALHDAECSDISDPVKFYNDGRMRTLQLKRIGNEAARRAFVDGFPLESVQGEPVRETDFVSIEQICKMLDAGKAYLDDVFNEDDDVTITKGAACGPTVSPDALEQKTPAPLSGRWRNSAGVLCCGTLRIAVESFDTDPAPEVKQRIMDWMCAILNAAQDSATMAFDSGLRHSYCGDRED